MSDQLWLAVIVAATLVILLVLYRRQLSHLVFKVGQEGIEAEVETHSLASPAPINPTDSQAPPSSAGLVLRDIDQIGDGHQILVEHDNAHVSGIRQSGEGHSLTVGSEGKRERQQPS